MASSSSSSNSIPLHPSPALSVCCKCITTRCVQYKYMVALSSQHPSQAYGKSAPSCTAAMTPTRAGAVSGSQHDAQQHRSTPVQGPPSRPSPWHNSTYLHVCWECPADLLGVRQVEVVHGVDELLTGFCQPRVEAFLLPDAAHAAASVVVARQHQGIIREGEQLGVDVIIQ